VADIRRVVAVAEIEAAQDRTVDIKTELRI
jgi:hypothetical protein